MKVCILTGTRAEYGLLSPLIQAINERSDFELQLVVTGMHLSHEFGSTYKQIEEDGLYITEKIEILLSSDSPVGTAKSMGLMLISFSETLERLKPDLMIGLGDRFELFSGVAAAHTIGIPVAHLHGGELTFGAIDDGFRHAITKMSSLHFTSTDDYRKRVIQLGEEPDRVFNVGAIGLDQLSRIQLLSRQELEKKIGIRFNKRNLLITYHPETSNPDWKPEDVVVLLAVLAELEECTLIFTKANGDSGGRAINALIDEFVRKNAFRSFIFDSLGQVRYLSLLKQVDAVVGNSSSGIIEAPSLGTVTVNIGRRQEGRVRAATVLDCELNRHLLRQVIAEAFLLSIRFPGEGVCNPYGDGRTTERIMDVLSAIDYSSLKKKKFHDVGW